MNCKKKKVILTSSCVISGIMYRTSPVIITKISPFRAKYIIPCIKRNTDGAKQQKSPESSSTSSPVSHTSVLLQELSVELHHLLVMVQLQQTPTEVKGQWEADLLQGLPVLALPVNQLNTQGGRR